jgi:predicted nucleic acid-binding protein
MNAILDAGPLVSLWGRADREKVEHREWAKKLFATYAGPFYTTELVLSEVAHLTGRDVEISELVSAGYFLPGCQLWEDAPLIERCVRNYPHCDLADASLIAASEHRPKLKILTTDRRHFLTYRRNDGSPLPLVLP